MNNARQEILEKCLALIQEAYDDLEMVRDDEEDAYDNMPEGLQESDCGDMMQEAIDALDEALSSIEMAKDDLESVCIDAADDVAADYNPYDKLKPGDTIKHKSAGFGTVKSIDGKYLVVTFPEKEMKFIIPDAFIKGFLSL